MIVTYHRKSNTLHVELRAGTVIESDEHRPGIIFDYDEFGRIVSIEILDAARNVDDVENLHFSVAPE